MNSQVAMEHMIRTRQLQMKFENDKDAAIKSGMSAEDLEQKINQLAAARDFDIQKSEERMEREKVEREAQVRQEQEERIAQEKKDLQQKAGEAKKGKLI